MWPVSELLEEHQPLAAKLVRFDPVVSGQLVAALALAPELHANTIRIEALTHLVAVACRGRAIPDGRNLIEWTGRLMTTSPLAREEDPIEDVFVGCVNCGRGSFRVLNGIATDKDFWVERLLRQLKEKDNFPPIQPALSESLALLKMSDALIERLGFERYEEGGGRASGTMSVPSRSDMQDYLSALRFNSADLAEIGVDPAALAPFLFSDHVRPRLGAQTIWNSELCRRPLRLCGDGVEFVMPSAVVRALQHRLLEALLETGLGGWANLFFQTACANEFISDVGRRLQIRPLQFPAPPVSERMPLLYPFFGQFDAGKPAILLTFCPPLAGALTEPEGCDAMTEQEVEATTAYLHACAERLEQMPGFSGGLMVINLVGLRSIMFELPRVLDRWQVHSDGMPDWLILSAQSGFNSFRLWRFGQQRAKLEAGGTRLVDMAGFLNTYSFWKANDYRLLRRDMSRSTTILNLTCDFGVHLRADSLKRADRHAVPAHEGADWVCLEQRYAWPLFEEDRELRLYVDREAAGNGRLVGCVERGDRRCWIVIATDPLPEEIKSIAYQLWDCFANWAARVTNVFEERFTAPGTTSIEFRINFLESETWKLARSHIELVPSAELEVSTDREKATTTLGIPCGFLRYFNEPKNTAERKIVTAMVEAMATMLGVALSQAQSADLLKVVIPNDAARHFHMFHVTDLEHQLADSMHSDPLLVGEEDLAMAHASVADLVGAPQAGRTVTGFDACLRLLKIAVEKIWEQLEGRLKQIRHSSVVAACLAELDELHREEEHWDWTARSALALHKDAKSVHEVLHDRRYELHRARLANRLLVEISQYAAGLESAPVLSQTDHKELSAFVILLLELAHHRDAISFGFMKPEITVHPNGEIGVDEEFYEHVVSGYVTQRSLEQTQTAVADYEQHYSKYRVNAAELAPEMPAEVRHFDEVFANEFGFGMTQLVDLTVTLHELGISAQTPGGVTGEAQLFGILNRAGFDDSQAKAFVARFTLPLRASWDGDLPPCCSPHDAFPWRFRRQLSLLVRPLVALSPDTWYLSIPMVRRACSYVVGNSSNAYFPEAFFTSPEMRRYIGDTVNNRGHEFAQQVRDELTALGLKTDLEVEMSALGAPKKEGLGDVDVLAWNSAKGKVYVVECKCLRTASNVREIVQRLEDFKGNRKEKDSLARHLRRIEWLMKNPAALLSRTRISAEQLRIVPLLVTNETVPMQFFKEMNFPVHQVVPIKELRKTV